MTKMADVSEAATFRNQLDALSIKFVADFRRRDAKACAEVYTDDAVLMLPGAAPIRGRTEIAAGFQAAFDAGRVIERLTTTRAESDAISAMPSRLFTGRERMALSCSLCVATRMRSGWCVVRR